MTKKHNWLVYALITVVTWGIWGAFSSTPDFPATLTYVVWALSMIPCAIVALANIKFKLDTKPRAVILSMGVGLLGAGGQLILFEALKHGPAYLIFPLISVLASSWPLWPLSASHFPAGRTRLPRTTCG